MNEIIDFSLSQGFTTVKVIQTGSIVVQDEVVEKGCAACPKYGHYLSCPPVVETPQQFRKYLASFRQALLVQLKGKLSGDPVTVNHSEALGYAARMNQSLLTLEAFCQELGFPRARSFIGGHCQLCDSCVEPGSACRHPEEMRTSMDANGINVVETCAAAGCPLEFPVTDSVTWTGLVLLD